MKRKTIQKLSFLFFFPLVLFANSATTNIDNSFAPPLNDDCVNASSLMINPDYLCATNISGTLQDATASAAPGGCPGVATKANDDVWYKFVATSTNHRIELQNINGPDLYHMIYNGGQTGDCSTMTAIACSDPEISNLAFLTVGNTYFIRVYSNSPASGANTTFDICVGTMPAAPSNDACSGAVSISSLPFNAQYDASSATNNLGFIIPSSCVTMNDGVWFTLVGDGGTITLSASPNNWDVGIGIYTGSCGTFICDQSTNDGGVGFNEGIAFLSVLGTTYYVNIGYPSGTIDQPEGIFNLAVTSSTLSIDDILKKGFRYYPNPVKNKLTMKADESIKSITLYSAIGRQIMHINQDDVTAELSLDNLATGTYFVKAFVGNSSGTFTIIKD